MRPEVDGGGDIRVRVQTKDRKRHGSGKFGGICMDGEAGFHSKRSQRRLQSAACSVQCAECSVQRAGDRRLALLVGMLCVGCACPQREGDDR